MIACACEHCGHEFHAEPEGGHRLLCGDATSADDVGRLMGGEEADICFTSPPYAQQRDYKTGPQDWDDLMHGVFSILPVKHGAQVLVNLGLVHRDRVVPLLGRLDRVDALGRMASVRLVRFRRRSLPENIGPRRCRAVTMHYCDPDRDNCW